MPWKNETTMDQKIAFIREWQSGRYHFNSLCEAYGISRQAGYNLIKRYKKEGLKCLENRSRRPINSPGLSSSLIVEKTKFWRDKKGWGARLGLVIVKKRRRKVKPSNPVFDPESCNEIWSIDYKGSFLLGNKKRCHPLTICDSFSRYILRIQGHYNETTSNVKRVLRQVFLEYGLPKYLHSDNGSCFASIQSPSGYGDLSYWLIDHGVIPVFSDPGRPDQNGRHERMHRDLKSKCCKPPSANLRSQNRRMNSFVREYNDERPHEHLDMQLPAQIHERSVREWRDKVEPTDYDVDMLVKRVTNNGSIRWRSYEWVRITNCLKGKYVGLRHLGNKVWEVHYRNLKLGYFHEGEQQDRGYYILLESDLDMNGRKRYKH